MARIAGVELPRNKRIEIALTGIYGIGRFTASRILERIALDPGTRTEDLTEDDVTRLRDAIDRLPEVMPTADHSYYNTKIEGDLRRQTEVDIKRLTDINCYRGVRHRKGLPVRGQRTSTNARTRKGRARTVSVGRKAKVKH
jgi:small subunit ribosomal protein S13